MTALQRRLDRMEAHSTWGSASEIEASELLFMRVPDGAVDDPRVTAARESAARKRKQLNITTAPESRNMPFWALVPLDRIPDALLDARIAELRLPARMSDTDIDMTIAALRTAIAQERCTP